MFQPGSHGSTFGGNILASTAGLTTLDIVETENLCKNATEMGEHIRDSLRRALAETPGVKEIRGQGLLIGIELDRPCGELVKTGLDAGLLINVTADNVVRLVPPLIISRAEADQLVNELTPLIRSFLMKPAPATAG